jgi:PBSX family phage terminase large subunit
MSQTKKSRILNDRQIQAQREIVSNKEILYWLLFGGSRSGKSFFVVSFFIKVCMKYPGVRLLICRQSQKSCKDTIWTQTLIKVLSLYNDRQPGFNNTWKQNGLTIQFRNGSEIRGGGFDNKIHEDAILGSEYAMIFVNEATDISFQIFQKLKSRLNWLDVPLLFFMDCNPKAPSHWLNRYFVQNLDPESREKLKRKETDRLGVMRFHPSQNKENLSAIYLEELEALKGLAKKRFWDGVWAEDLEGLVFTAFDRKVNVVENPIEYDPNAETFSTWDFGTADPTHIWVGQIKQVPKSPENHLGIIINIIDEYQNRNESVQHYKDWFFRQPYAHAHKLRHFGDPSGKNRDAQLKSWIMLLAENPSIFVEYKKRYTIDEYVDCANLIIPYLRICEKQCPIGVECFENWKYPLGPDGKKQVGAKPEHDQYSHPGSAFYYFAANRFPSKGGQLIG